MADLRDVIVRLIRRPVFWRADPPLPMVAVTGENAFEVAAWLAAPFEDSVPNATLREGAHPTVFALVERLAGEEDGRLGRPVGGSFLPPPRFPLVQFVLWARDQPTGHGDRETKNRLKDWRRSKYGGDRGVKTAADFVIRAATTWVPVGTLAIWWAGGSADVVGALPWLFGALVALFGTAAQGALSIRGSMFTGAFRRMPVVRRKPLERLHLYTQRVRDATPEQTEQLLVNALCQDLRDAYRKWLIPWPSWGRGLYCLLVLEIDRPDGANARFLRLLENSARDAGLFPPMLVLAAGPAAAAPSPDRPAPAPLTEFAEELARWRAVARRRVPRLRLALASGGPPPAQSFRFRRLGSQLRAGGYWLVIAALLLVPAAGVAWSNQERKASCGGLAWVELLADECVGVVNAGTSAPAEPFIPEVQKLVERIDDNNDYAVDSGKYVSVVVFGEYSIRKSAENDTRLAGVLSELTAAEEYQRATSSTPRVRVLLANAGNEYLHAQRAAQLVTELAAADPTVMGVVGFGRSVAGVRQAVEVLHNAKIPMVATTPTADRLGYVGKEGPASPYYFHVGPTNYREAELGARYIKRKLLENDDTPTAVIVQDGTPQDEYTNNLAEDFKATLPGEGVVLKGTVSYTVASGGISNAVVQACELGADVIVYAGRAPEFRDFLKRVESSGCGSGVTKVVAGDDVVKVVADFGAEIAGMEQVEVYHLSLANRATWAAADVQRTAFVRQLLDGGHTTATDDHLLLTYDALSVIHDAAGKAYQAATATGLPSRGDILYRLSRMSGSNAWEGSSGVIEFGPGDQHTPVDKALTILKVVAGKPRNVDPVVRCGRLDASERAEPDELCRDLSNVAPR
jgi:hypothetical protein